ncbi:MAG TPA: glutamate 5-kinase [Opitutales bacterium]|jgi:glutamate 5-kinase|nr:glutamate 5-kinase [Opitutales bacterium]
MSLMPGRVRRVVLKIGTGVLTSGVGQLDTQKIMALGREVAALQKSGIQVLIVSSGAVGLGMGRLGLTKRPAKLTSVQKCAAVGQGILIDTWQKAFNPFGLTVAQLLYTRDNLGPRGPHLAVKEMLDEILEDGIIPVINENDSVSTEELKFGDNDTLSALVASLAGADLLILLSTAPGLVDRKGTGKILPVVEKITPEIEALAGGTESVTAVGGMVSKLAAVKIAARSGCGVIIASGADAAILSRLLAGTGVGTFFVPEKIPLDARKRWLAWFQQPAGNVRVDAGAERALREKGGSLLAKGVTGIEGAFVSGDVVAIVGASGTPIARGVVQFSAAEARTIAGQDSTAIAQKFPGRKKLEVVHRDSLVLL